MAASIRTRASAPVGQLLGEVGDMVILTGKTLVSAVRRPYPYGSELTAQILFALRVSWLPLLVTSFVICFAVPGIQAGGFFSLYGAADRLGGIAVLAVIREFAPIVCAIIVTGVAGTAMTADLGARKIREELDALLVLGVDPVKNLVVPRFLALVLVTACFDVFAIVVGVAGALLAAVVQGVPVGSFLGTFFSAASTTDLWASVVKCTAFGGIAAVVCCYKGMTASGGAAGVGRAVNEAVVLALLAVSAFNYVFTQTLLATHPEMMLIR